MSWVVIFYTGKKKSTKSIPILALPSLFFHKPSTTYNTLEITNRPLQNPAGEEQ